MGRRRHQASPPPKQRTDDRAQPDGSYHVGATGSVRDRAGLLRSRTMTAAVQVLQGPNARIDRGRRRTELDSKHVISQPWQHEAWMLHDEIGELAAAMRWHGRAVSRVRLVAAMRQPGEADPEPLNEGLAADLLAQFAGGPDGQAALLGRAAQHLSLVGDTYIVGRASGTPDDEQPGADEWRAYSTEEASYKGPIGRRSGRWQIDDGDGPVDLTDTDVVIRCWDPHPRKYKHATSAVLSSLPVLRELRGLTMHVGAQIDSRLAGAGLLVLPQSIEFPGGGEGAETGDEDGETGFIDELQAAMITPIKDRDHASAVVPLTIQVPDEAVGKIQHIRFSSELDAGAQTLREEALLRWARSADMPPEVLQGMSDTNHWSAWKISEESVALHITPLAQIIALSLTVGWLRHALVEAGMPPEEAARHLIWVDSSPLTQRPDRSESAVALYDRAEISGEALRRESGFDESDRPDDRERQELVLFRLVQQAPSLAPIVLPLLGITLAAGDADAAREVVDATKGSGGSGGSGGDGPGRQEVDNPEDLPDTQADRPDDSADVTASAAPQLGGVLLAAHVACVRALEVAGKRLLTRDRRSRYLDVDPWLLHTKIKVHDSDLERLLTGAWTALDQALVDAPEQWRAGALAAALDGYVRRLLLTGQPHTLSGLYAALTGVDLP